MRPQNIPGTHVPDLSSLKRRPGTPGKDRPQVNPLGVPQNNANFAPNPYGADIGELTPDERNKVVILWREIAKRYEYREMDETTVTQLVNECRERFANELGLVVDLTWDGGVDVDADPNSEKVYFLPNLVLEARVSEVATDYEQIARETQEGLADGKVGVFRDGEVHEDAKRKQIK